MSGLRALLGRLCRWWRARLRALRGRPPARPTKRAFTRDHAIPLDPERVVSLLPAIKLDDFELAVLGELLASHRDAHVRDGHPEHAEWWHARLLFLCRRMRLTPVESNELARQLAALAASAYLPRELTPRLLRRADVHERRAAEGADREFELAQLLARDRAARAAMRRTE